MEPMESPVSVEAETGRAGEVPGRGGVEDDGVIVGPSAGGQSADARTQVRLLDHTPFDLEAVLATHQGRVLIERLVHVARHCPQVAAEAYHAALQEVKVTTKDVALYLQIQGEAHGQVSAGAAGADVGAGGAAHTSGDEMDLSEEWVESTIDDNRREKDKLDVELKNYKNNLIKESIRLGYHDLGEFFYLSGDFVESSRSFLKALDYGTCHEHTSELYKKLIQVYICARDWHQVANYSTRAMQLLEPEIKAKVNAPLKKADVARNAERKASFSRLLVSRGLAELVQGQYEEAARSFLSIDPAALVQEKRLTEAPGGSRSTADELNWARTGLPPNGSADPSRTVRPISTQDDLKTGPLTMAEIAVYGVLCALGTFERKSIKSLIIDNSDLSVLSESEPYITDLAKDFVENNFKQVFTTLERYQPVHLLDVHLAPHIVALTRLIRARAMALFTEPFEQVGLDRLTSSFMTGQITTVREVEHELIELIQSGTIKGRIDREKGLFVSTETDARNELFTRAIEAGEREERRTRAILTRLRLIQAGLVIRAPKEAAGGPL